MFVLLAAVVDFVFESIIGLVVPTVATTFQEGGAAGGADEVHEDTYACAELSLEGTTVVAADLEVPGDTGAGRRGDTCGRRGVRAGREVIRDHSGAGEGGEREEGQR